MTLFTAGYEGVNAETFWSVLQANDIEVLVDVRGNPISRKPGFSMTPLRSAAEARGVRYEHWKSLGCPRPILLEYRETQDWAHYTEQFWDYIRTQKIEVLRLVETAKAERCCLVCFEADPNYCHRSYVAEFASELDSDLEVVHLNVRQSTLLLPLG